MLVVLLLHIVCGYLCCVVIFIVIPLKMFLCGFLSNFVPIQSSFQFPIPAFTVVLLSLLLTPTGWFVREGVDVDEKVFVSVAGHDIRNMLLFSVPRHDQPVGVTNLVGPTSD